MKPDPYITTSWDDGYPLDMRLAERLAYYRLPATFYIPFASSRPVLDHAQIRQLATTFEIGAHTVTHPDLRTLCPDRARQEIFDSRSYVEDIIGRKCAVFAPPAGSFSHSHQTMVRKAGFSGMRTVELMSLRRPVMQQGLVMIATSLQFYPHGPAAYLRNTVRRLRLSNYLVYLKNAHCRTLEQATASLLQQAETDGGVFHLWGHSWELEEEGLWPALEDTFRLLQESASNFRLVCNGDLLQEALPHERAA